MATIFQTTFSNAFSWKKMYQFWLLKFVPKGPINSIRALVQIMAWRRSGDKPLFEPMMVSLLTHICVTWPQWVKTEAMAPSESAARDSWCPAGTRRALQWSHNERHGVSVTGVLIVCWTVYSGADQIKHQSSVSLAFVRGIHRSPVDSPHKGPVTRRKYPFDDVIMWSHRFSWAAVKRKLVPKGPIDNFRFRQWLDTEQATSRYLNRWWQSSTTLYGVTKDVWFFGLQQTFSIGYIFSGLAGSCDTSDAWELGCTSFPNYLEMSRWLSKRLLNIKNNVASRHLKISQICHIFFWCSRCLYKHTVCW